MTYISPERRHKSATVRSGGKEKFPVDSVHTATSAKKLINSAKPPLSPGQRSRVSAEIHKYLPGAEIPSPKSKKKK